MTIGVDVSRALRVNKTGVEWYAYYLMNALHALDSSSEYRLYADTKIMDDVDVSLQIKIRVLKWPIAHLWTQGRLSLEMLLHPPDVLLIPASAMPMIHPQKTVVVVHDVGFLAYAHYKSKKEMRYLHMSTDYALRHAWRIITVSEWTKQEIQKNYGCSDERIRVVPNGVDQNFYHAIDTIDANATLKRLCISRPFFLTVGRLDPRKNIRALISAFSLFAKIKPSYSLIVAGPEGYAAKDTLEAIKEAQRAGISIHYLSWISESDKRALLCACTAFVFPSLYEGFGMPILEAQLCQAPVIASSIPALKETSGGAAYFFNPENVDSLMEGLRYMDEHFEYRKKLQEEGLRNAQLFSWQITASMIDAICREL